MSRVGKLPVKIPSGVKVTLASGVCRVEGPKGKLSQTVPEGIDVKVEGDEVRVSVKVKNPKTACLYGTTRSLIQNMVKGCSEEFKKSMNITGVGYKAQVKGSTLNLTLGFSHPVEFPLPEGISAKVEKNTLLTLSGADKVVLGRVASEIRALRPPEPYQGKGIKYTDEQIQRKQGKSAVAK